MGKAIASGVVILAIIYVVPFLVYGAFSATGVIELPEGASPARLP